MGIDFSKKRVEHLNGWPTSEPFDTEKEYCGLVRDLKKEKGSIFVPFEMVCKDECEYNNVISFMIDALNQLEISQSFI